MTIVAELLAACLAAAAAAGAGGDGLIASPEPDWPQWRGPRRDGISAETNLLPAWPEGGPKRLWKASGLGRGWSSPIIVRGTLFITGDVGERLVIFAYGLDGKRKWRVPNGRAWKRPWGGARASCVYSAGRLYHMNAHGRVVCLDPATGKEVWSVNVLERFAGRNITWGLSECLLVDGRRLIVTPGGRKGLIVALDKATGETLWASEAIPGDRAGYASPILFAYGGLRHLVGFSSGHAFGADADSGRLLWKVPRPTRYHVIGSMAVYHEGTVFVSSPDGKAAELLRLHVDGKDVRAEPVWTSELNNLTGGVILRGGRLYGAGYRRNDFWLCVDHKTGKTLHAKRDLHSGSAVWADGLLYCLSERGQMALLRPAAEGLDVRGQFRLIEKKARDVWAHPVIHAGRLYLRYHDHLWCYDIRAK